MDRIVVPGVPLRARVGVTAEERKAPQDIVVGLVLYLDLRRAGTTDDLANTIDYDAACATATRVVGSRPYHLIEAIAEEVAGIVLDEYDVAAVDVRVEKPGALRARGVPFAAVEIHRTRDG
ncbi:MAG: dihydroneopterin aldolase [Gemmatimonadota bacterium]|nr:dihydroneopterin aldolase [Gemmatimonadota bacterium]